jgi:ssDNA-binding Zn-finger/Zn-ribbon topoisomerase 1
MICPYCEYEWEPRKKNPKQCPVCKRYLVPVKVFEVVNEYGDVFIRTTNRERAANIAKSLSQSGLTVRVKERFVGGR